MLSFVLWFVLITLIGWLAFPLTWRLLPKLPDRGFTLSRPLGLLVWGYSFWLLASFKILQNNPGGIVFALIILAGLSFLSVRGARWVDFRDWISGHKGQILTTEIIFLVAFAAWAFLRSLYPEVSGTEKPMELAFINAILRSPVFPPHDPWLSGYAISYYYFGYILVAMMTMLTRVTSGVAFNLAISMWFALTAVGAYGILYNLLSLRYFKGQASLGARLSAILAPLFLLIVSNLEGFFEMLHAKGLFWQNDAGGNAVGFWQWLDLKELTNPPAYPYSWTPNRPGGIWWWRASRVLGDYSLNGDWHEVIDEFPFFSYYLADLHPHVLAMPFALLVVGLALNFFLSIRESLLPDLSFGHWFRAWGSEQPLPFGETFLGTWLRTPGFWLAAVALGAMAFVNTWDFPIYLALFSAAYVLARFQHNGWGWARIGEFLEVFIVLAVIGALLYLPFYVGFSSQAGGILPSLSFFTRGVQFWIMFGSLLVPVAIWLVATWIQRADRNALVSGLKFSALAVFGLWALSYLFAGLITTLVSSIPRFASLNSLFLGLHGATSSTQLLLGSLSRRLAQPGAWITLFMLLILIWGLLSTFKKHSLRIGSGGEGELESLAVIVKPDDSAHSADSFVLLLLLLGAGLTLFPEFFYLRDQFGSRMNTIFKFYFEAWLLWSLAASYAFIGIARLRGAKGVLLSIVTVIVLAMSLAYPIYGIKDRFNGYSPDKLTLDGNAWFAQYNKDEADAIQFLRNAPEGVVAEAVGGQYSAYARVATYSGQPSVMGWPGHESQWRGSDELFRSRPDDIAQLYQNRDWSMALQILRAYNIRYVYIGSLERSTYRIIQQKFDDNLVPIYRNNSVIIYEVPDLQKRIDLQPGG